MAAPITSTSRTAAEHRFFTAMALAVLVTVFVGFSRSFFLRPMFPDWPAPYETIFYVHGTVFAAWVGLLLVQTSLVAAGRTDLHRKAGVFGALLAVAMLILGTVAALIAARRATGFVGVPVPPLQFLAVPIFDMVLFPAFVALALFRRREPQYHKRLMLLATIVLTTAAIARWPGVFELGPLAFFGLTDLFVVALAIWDRRVLGRLHPVTLWGGLTLVASQPLRLVVSGTDAWLAFARWATGLLG
ncbi:hypothetical protein FBR04_18060 [Betaproteobacteria bacterium PRO7]|jgi:uncharacterized membrane protein YozB (DUF420 family)|nr:hypothetical protein [Betaproteobacteria bacterium PRO7]GIL06785.1 MAG: hypothetical protein BroJett031_33050 [Betaproteobacteria bacterium]